MLLACLLGNAWAFVCIVRTWSGWAAGRGAGCMEPWSGKAPPQSMHLRRPAASAPSDDHGAGARFVAMAATQADQTITLGKAMAGETLQRCFSRVGPQPSSHLPDLSCSNWYHKPICVVKSFRTHALAWHCSLPARSLQGICLMACRRCQC